MSRDLNQTCGVSGYLHPSYAESYAEYGRPYQLSQCSGWIIKRQIPEFPDYDAMGCYPLFFCRDWSKLHEDLNALEQELICLSLVTDPFGKFETDYLNEVFKKSVVPYKEHFVVDLSRSPDTFVSAHHRRYSKKSLQDVLVEQCHDPLKFLDDWVDLYRTLVRRHGIKGMLAFSKAAFQKQLSVPGIVAFRAVHEEKTIGMLLWYKQDNIAYYHLGAFNEVGYKLRASFALFWSAIEYFTADGVRYLNLGAGAGVKGDTMDGLSRFKKGWSTGTATVHFCSRIFNEVRYLEIVKQKGVNNNNGYFPTYRQGEFE